MQEVIMYTIGKLSKKFGLSRSTLLYYDSLGLFSPSGRSSSNYRTYTEKDCARLEQICTYRRAGLPLKDIARIIKTNSGKGVVYLLKKRLEDLNNEIRALRNQQHFIVTLLKNNRAIAKAGFMDKKRWIQLLQNSGLDETARSKWHTEFERLAPEAHQDFLESLGIPPAEIILIRKQSRTERQI